MRAVQASSLRQYTGGTRGGSTAVPIAELRPANDKRFSTRRGTHHHGSSVGADFAIGAESKPQVAAPSLSLVLAQRDRLLAMATRLLGDREAAEDALQTAYLKALTRGARIRDPREMLWWFTRVLANAAVDVLRRREAHERLVRRFSAEDLLLRSRVPVDDEVGCHCVNELLETLRPTYARILRHVDLVGASLHEAAEVEGLTMGNARVRLHRARRTLRRRVIEVCGDAPLLRCVTCVRAPDRTDAGTKSTGGITQRNCNAAGGSAFSN